MAPILKNDWADLLAAEFEKPYYQQLRAFLIEEYRRGVVYPDMYDIFNALHYTPYSETKVCILGQDPYHGPGQAHGLSFSVKPGVPPPPASHRERAGLPPGACRPPTGSMPASRVAHVVCLAGGRPRGCKISQQAMAARTCKRGLPPVRLVPALASTHGTNVRL